MSFQKRLSFGMIIPEQQDCSLKTNKQKIQIDINTWGIVGKVNSFGLKIKRKIRKSFGNEIACGACICGIHIYHSKLKCFILSRISIMNYKCLKMSKKQDEKRKKKRKPKPHRVVNGVPSSGPLNPFDIVSSFDVFLANIKCIYNAVNQFMDESNLDDLWHNAKIQLKTIVDVEWANCLGIVDEAEQEKCKTVVIGHGVHVVTKFVNQLVYDHKLNLDWHKLRTDIVTKCFAKNTFIE